MFLGDYQRIALLGHQVVEALPQKTDLNTLLDALAQVAFTRQADNGLSLTASSGTT